MGKSRRERIRDLTRAEIKAAARDLMAEKGTAGLSMRAIGRRMDMTAAALYHYYGGLSELITALILDAFVQMADYLEAAAATPESEGAAAQLRAVANAQRSWALAHPIDFQLIYGNPIPDYEQPVEMTYPPARRSFLVTARIFARGLADGALVLPAGYQTFSPELTRSLEALTAVEGHDLPLPALYLTASAWSRIHGLIMLELFNLIQPVVNDTDAFFKHEIDQFLEQIGFRSEA